VSGAVAVRLDGEVAELLRESPDLLAIADAITATQPAPRRHVARTRTGLRFAAIAAVVALAAALALIAPWDGRSAGFVERALAALGDGRVIHVVSTSDVPGRAVIDLKTGAETPVQATTEIWFDEARGLQRTVMMVGGALSVEELQTPEGAWTQDGRVYTCAWIAAHPVEATKARVSCSASGDNGTTPRQVPEERPVLDPALAGFVGGYQDALAAGTAVRDGAGVVDGRKVEWLKFESEDSPPPGEPTRTRVERVAVDGKTLKPMLVETTVAGRQGEATRIASIETVAGAAADFSRPKQAPASESPVATSVKSKAVVTSTVAAAALNGRLLSAGSTLDGLLLTSMTLQQIVTGYGASSGVPPTHSQGVEVLYGGTIDWASAADYIVIKESLRPQMLYGFGGPFGTAPAAGSMATTHFDVSAAAPGSTQAVPTGKTIWRGQLQHDGVYVAIETTRKTLLLDAARALTRVEPK
jgi:hypothetical protein